MDVLDKEKVRLLIKDYGTLEVLKELSEALKENADNYSDMGVREKALDSIKVADLLDDVVYVLDQLNDIRV